MHLMLHTDFARRLLMSLALDCTPLKFRSLKGDADSRAANQERANLVHRSWGPVGIRVRSVNRDK